MLNDEDFEVPLYLVLDDKDAVKGIDKITSKLKDAGKIVENKFLRTFSDTSEEFQTLIKLGNQLYSVVGKLKKDGTFDKRTSPTLTPVKDMSEAQTLFYSKSKKSYNDNMGKIAFRRQKKLDQELAKENAKNTKKEQVKNLKQIAFDDKMRGLSSRLTNKDYSSSKEFRDIGREIGKEIAKAMEAELDVSSGVNANMQYSDEENRMKNTTSKMGEIFKGALNPLEIAKMQLSSIRQRMQEIEDEMMVVGDGERLQGLKKELTELAKDAEKLEKKTRLSGIQKLFNTFKRVGFYRIARRAFQLIEQGFGESLLGMAKFDSGINQSMSQIQSSFSLISASIVSLIGPILDTVAPMLQQMAQGAASIANGFNQAYAKSKGLSKYTKINTDYMKDFASQTNSATLSFDKFETLSSSDDMSEAFETGDVNEELDNVAGFGTELFEIMKKLLSIIQKVWEMLAPLVTTIFELVTPILNIVDVLLEYLMPAIEWVIDIVRSGIEWISSMLDFISAFLYILTGDFDKAWDYIKTGFLKMISSMVNQLIDFLNYFIMGLDKVVKGAGKVVGLLGFDTSGWGIDKIEHIKLYANGGMVDRGSLFVAGESGAEFVTKMPSGQTGVTNVSQFKQAMVEALYECSDIFQQTNGNVVLNLDGAEIARSKSFKSELNRTNSGLNLR